MSALSGTAAVIRGLGTALPERRVTNEEICERLGVDADWIRSRTGIAARARAASTVSTADLAVMAGERALTSSGHGKADALVLATVTPDNRLPATAPEVAARLNLVGIPAFDLSAACAGLLYALQVAAGFIAAGAARRVLVIAADRIPAMIDPTDRMTAPLFGEGASAVVVEAGFPDDPGALGPILLAADGRQASAIVAPHGGFLSMQGQATFQHAVTSMSALAQDAAEAAGWSLDSDVLLVPHQANARITDAVGRRLGLDGSQAIHHIEQLGNTSAASLALALAAASADGRLRPGRRVLLVAFGAGFVSGATTLVWPALTPLEGTENR